MKALPVLLVVLAGALLAAPARAQDVVQSFTLDAVDKEYSEYKVVAGGRYGLLMKGTLTDDAGGLFDALYCRNDKCGGAGTYVDNVIGMGFTDVDRQEYEGTFGPISKYVDPLPLYAPSPVGYAVQFTAPRSGRLELITNHGNLTGRPNRQGQLTVDLYRYSEPSGGGTSSETGATTTADPCAALAAALAPSSATSRRAHAAQVDPCASVGGKRYTAPAAGKTKTIRAKIGGKATKMVVTVANGATGHIAIGIAGRRERARRKFNTYAYYCMLAMELNPITTAAFNMFVRQEAFGFKTGSKDQSLNRFAACQLASIIATVRAIEAEDAAAAPQTGGPPSSSACIAGRVAVTHRVKGVKTNVSRSELPGLRIGQKCVHSPNGVMTLTYTATGGRTLAQELGGRTFPITIGRGPDGTGGGTLALALRANDPA